MRKNAQPDYALKRTANTYLSCTHKRSTSQMKSKVRIAIVSILRLRYARIRRTTHYNHIHTTPSMRKNTQPSHALKCTTHFKLYPNTHYPLTGPPEKPSRFQLHLPISSHPIKHPSYPTTPPHYIVLPNQLYTLHNPSTRVTNSNIWILTALIDGGTVETASLFWHGIREC
jgi:hypothetical protein